MSTDDPTSTYQPGGPGWYPDPFGRAEARYHDGQAWTDQVASHGRPATDRPGGRSKVPTVHRATEKVQREVSRASMTAGAVTGGGTLFSEPILVVNQKAKLIELHNEYAVYDQHGTQIGAVRQVAQSKGKKLVRLLSGADQFLTHKLQIVDASGVPVLVLTRPAKLLKSRFTVADRHGQPLGEIVQENVIGKIHFGLPPAADAWERSGARTGGPGTSPSPTRTEPRSLASPRPGKGWPRRCSPPRTTTSCRSPARWRTR